MQPQLHTNRGSGNTQRQAGHLPVRTALTRPFQIAPAQNTRPTIWEHLQLPLLIFGSIFVGFFVQSLLFGLIATALYGAFAFTFRVPSRATFMLAFMALVTVVVLLVAKPDAMLANNFATYTFLLLVIGVIALAIEARPPKRKRRKRADARLKRRPSQ
jgi:hypothetical protein